MGRDFSVFLSHSHSPAAAVHHHHFTRVVLVFARKLVVPQGRGHTQVHHRRVVVRGKGVATELGRQHRIHVHCLEVI